MADVIELFEDGTIVEREFTDEEKKQKAIDAAKLKQEQEDRLAAENKKIAAKAKLAALGLTEEDLQALGL